MDVYNDPLLALADYNPGIYDLLLLDIKMTKMDGFELYKKIQDKEKKMKDHTTDYVDDKSNVSFITAFELYFYEEITKEVFPELGVSRIIRKLISIDELVEYLKEELGTIRCC